MKPILAYILPAALALCGCTRHDNLTDRSDANAMYGELKQLAIAWTDSLISAGDSASIAHATESYEEQLVKINFRYPPGTDMKMTEGQQDTLFRLTSRFVEIKSQKKPRAIAPDSIAPDTIAANNFQN